MSRACMKLGEYSRRLGKQHRAKEVVSLKDRLGNQRGGSEWEPIKILLLRENSA
jgi:hypothetical protein